MSGRPHAVVKIGGEEYAIDVAETGEVVTIGIVSRLFRMQAPIRGLMNLRGRALPVVDTTALLKKDSASPEPTLGIVLKSDGKEAIFLIDQFLRIDKDPAGDVDKKATRLDVAAFFASELWKPTA